MNFQQVEKIKSQLSCLETEDLKALEETSLAIQLAPHYAPAYLAKGMVLDEMDQLEEAVELYQKAVILNPKFDDAKEYYRYAFDELVKRKTSQDERILACLAHGSVLIPFAPVFFPAILWFIYRKKSQYVEHQALQALIFQILAFVVPMSVVLFTFIIAVITRPGGPYFILFEFPMPLC